MRWILAGAAFALLVTLAVATVAIKVTNRAARARVEQLTFEFLAVQVERHRQAEWFYQRAQSGRLQEQLRQLLSERLLATRTLSERVLE